METLHRGANWKISVYGRERGVAHFHIEGPDFRCSVGIGSLEVIVGQAPSDVLRIAVSWARANRNALMAKWRELNG